ncbi:MAG TPA: energy transducer TonB [Pyrinomonadaceae bacterium]|nr:energy transducer TonB [Pyrinomonadaceae bacterium]
MKLTVLLSVVLILSPAVRTQSGRRAKPAVTSPPPVQETKTEPAAEAPTRPQVTAEKNQEYRCSDDNTLERILDSDQTSENVVTAKEADARAEITKRPSPDYTREARRNGIQGFVTLRVLLSANGEVSRVRVIKGLPAGLTENAIRAACKIQFKPGMKDGHRVSMWLTAEYAFRLADSSIFRP